MSPAMRLVRLLLCIADGLLQCLIRPRADRICYGSVPDFTDNAYYLFLHILRTRRNLEHIWLLHDFADKARVEADFARLAPQGAGHRLRVLAWHSLPGYWAFLRSACVVHTHGLFNFSRAALRGRVRLGLWHGMPLKCIGSLNTSAPNPTPQFATHHFATSYFFKYVMAQAFCVRPERVLVIGQPRNDALVFTQCRACGAAEIRQMLGIPPTHKIIAWLPTYRAEGAALRGASPARLRSFMDDVQSGALDQLLADAQRAGCDVVVKLHAYERSSRYEALPRRAGLHVYGDAQWRATGVQLYDFLAIADALISDVSSVLFDFTLTGRPIGCMGFSAQTYTRDLVFPIEQFLDAAAIERLDDPASVRRFVDRVATGEITPPSSSLAFFIPRPQVPASARVAELLP